MESATTINWQQFAGRLERYMEDLRKLTRRWQLWLEKSELQAVAALPASTTTDEHFKAEGLALIEQLRQLAGSRDALLRDAKESGWPATSLRELAQRLPNWNQARLRLAFDSARQQLEHLKRLHVATWVALRETADYYQEALNFVMSGGIRMDITIDRRQPESSGGLLDASL